ncbi:MAG: hypothetical protein IJ870_01690 [Alphaproteobacteria bacterium]|nr:hypothetical protein [Alphaproteobacteria bacterium]
MRAFWLFALFLAFAIEAKAQSEDFSKPEQELGKIETIQRPRCSDKAFEKKIQEAVQAYFQTKPSDSTVAKRRKVLKLKKLHDFEEVLAKVFTPDMDYRTANALIKIKINEHVKEDEIVLCKQGAQKGKAIYVIAYPYLDNFKVHIINLDEQNTDDDAVSFIYP